MNLLVGERISIATFKAQTTRHRIMGIVNTPEAQIVFSDTPGVLKPNYKLQESMLAFSESALQDADVLLYVTDVVEQWVATNKDKNYLEVLPHKEPEPPKPTPTELKVGDKVKIVGPYASSANSKSAPHTYAIGWTRYITKIHKGANYPYQVGNKGDTSSKGTTGFCKESSLKKL